MFLIEKMMSAIAPHSCISCGVEGAVVCDWCAPDFATPLPERCYRCRAQTSDSLVCQKCRRKSRLKHVWVRTFYENEPKLLIHDFKFERKLAAAPPMAQMMVAMLPHLPPGTVVTHVPTATSRVRRRGYDHAEELAKALAGKLGLNHKTLLRRVTQTRQVGSTRIQRLRQMEHAFQVVSRIEHPENPILLIDDLVTTGATLEAASDCLHEAGAKTINAAIFAQK